MLQESMEDWERAIVAFRSKISELKSWVEKSLRQINDYESAKANNQQKLEKFKVNHLLKSVLRNHCINSWRYTCV